MVKGRVLVIFSVVTVLFLVGYIMVNNWVKAQESGENNLILGTTNNENDIDGNNEDEGDDELDEAEKQFDKLFLKLEKAELKVEKAPMSLIVTPQRKTTLVNVNLSAIETATPGDAELLTVGIFGLTFEVDASEAKVYGGKEKSTLSDFEIGDKLLIKGVVNEDTGVIEATRIYNRSDHKKTIENLRIRIQELLKRIEELRVKLGITF